MQLQAVAVPTAEITNQENAMTSASIWFQGSIPVALLQGKPENVQEIRLYTSHIPWVVSAAMIVQHASGDQAC